MFLRKPPYRAQYQDEPDSVIQFRELVTPPASKDLGPHFDQLNTLIDALPNEGIPYLEYEIMNKAEEQCLELDQLVDQIRRIAIHFPWRLSALDVRTLEYAERRIQRTRTDVLYYASVKANGG